MITLQGLFDTLSYGELSNLTLRQESSDTLSDVHYPKIVSHINLGLGKLYQRFNLYTESIYLHLHEDVTRYYLRSEHAGELANMSDTLYIEETANRLFQDNLIKVLRVYDELEELVPLNDYNSDGAVRSVTFDTLDIDVEALEVQRLTLEFQASYPTIEITPTLDPSTYILNIPDAIIEALLFYVASRVYKPMGGNSSTADADKSDSYLQLYEMSCARLKADGASVEVNDMRNNFSDGGFV